MTKKILSDNTIQIMADSINIDDLIRDIESKQDDEKIGRGRRKCPQCGFVTGVRKKICDCGHEFNAQPQLTTSERRKIEDAATDEERKYAIAVSGSSGGTLVYTGCGKCPAKFIGDDYDSVASSCWEIVNEGLNENKIYMPSAIKHWTGHRFGFNSKKYKSICKQVDKWAKNVVENK